MALQIDKGYRPSLGAYSLHTGTRHVHIACMLSLNLMISFAEIEVGSPWLT